MKFGNKAMKKPEFHALPIYRRASMLARRRTPFYTYVCVRPAFKDGYCAALGRAPGVRGMKMAKKTKKKSAGKAKIKSKTKPKLKAKTKPKAKVQAKRAPSRKPVKAAKVKNKAKPKAQVKVAEKSATPEFHGTLLGLDLRYPYTGFRYRAEGPQRIRVDRGDLYGYFDADGRWLEGEIRSADGPFCRYMSSNWILAERAGKIRR